MKQILNISLSAAPAGIEALLSLLTVMTKSLDDADFDANTFKEEFKEWWKQAAPALRKYKLFDTLRPAVVAFLKNNMDMNGVIAGNVSKALQPTIAAINSDHTVPREHLQMFKDINLLMKKESEPAIKRLSKNISMLGRPNLNALFTDQEEVLVDSKLYQQMCALVQKMVGESRWYLTIGESAEINQSSEKDPRRVYAKKYSELRKEYIAAYKKALLQFVRQSGKPLVDVEEAREYLNDVGCNAIADNFVGQIDEVANYYTEEGRKLKGNPTSAVTMNPKYDPKLDNAYVCSVIGQKGGGRLYTVNYVAGGKQQKFEKVNSFVQNAEQHRKDWIADLMNSPDERKQVLAAVVETLYQTAQRIGTPGNATAGNATYGISTMLVKHIKVASNGTVNISYPGKKFKEDVSPMQHAAILPNSRESKKVIEIIKRSLVGKKPTDPVFTVKGKALPANSVTNYLKELGITITSHGFRHARGTALAIKILKTSKFNARTNKPSQVEADKWIKENLAEVGEALHHQTGGKVTATTAIAAYINPVVIHDWYTNLGLRVPKFVPAIDSADKEE